MSTVRNKVLIGDWDLGSFSLFRLAFTNFPDIIVSAVRKGVLRLCDGRLRSGSLLSLGVVRSSTNRLHSTHIVSRRNIASLRRYSLIAPWVCYSCVSQNHGFINTIWIPGKPDILMLAAAIRWAPSSQGINKQPKQRNQTEVLVSVSTLLDALYPMDSVIIF